VVVTDLLAEAVPLIRYDIGDLVVLADDVDRHGLPMLDRIEGRSRDIITAADGTPMSPFAVGYFLKGIEGIGRYQFIQEAAGRYRIRIVPMEGFDTEATIRAGLEEILGEGAELDIEYADRILLLPSGKASDVTVLSRFEETEDGASGR
jgi:phenylacetate-CoA ligase